MKKLIHDERSLGQKRIIESELYGLLMLILGISIIVKFYFMNGGLSSVMVEGVCFVFASVYYIIRSFSLGHSFYSKSFDIKTILLYTVASSVLCFVLAGYKSAYEFARVFIIIFVCGFIVNSILYLMNKNKQKRLDMELDLDDSE